MADDDNSKAEYAKPASQLDLEARQERGNASDAVLMTSDVYEAPEDDDGREFAVEGNDTDGYIGAGPEYRTYANETEAPLSSDEDSAEQKVADYFVETLNTDQVKPGAQASTESDKAGDTEPKDAGQEPEKKETVGAQKPSGSKSANNG